MKKVFLSFVAALSLVFMLTSCPGFMSEETCSVSFYIDGSKLENAFKSSNVSREATGADSAAECFMQISLAGDYNESHTVPFAQEMTVTFRDIQFRSKIRAIGRVYVHETGPNGSSERTLYSGESEEIVIRRRVTNISLPLGAPHTVTFNSNGGSSVGAQTVEYRKKAVRPANPTREGFVFAGWYVDEEFRTAFDFNTVITEDTTLYAKWVTAYSVNISSTITHGTVTADKTTVMPGETVTLTISANSGYEFNTLSVNNDEGVIISTTAITREGHTHSRCLREM